MATTPSLYHWMGKHGLRFLANETASLASTNETFTMTSNNVTMEGMEEEEYTDEFMDNKWMLVLPRITALISVLAVICVAIEAWKDLQADKHRSNIVRSSRIRRSTTTSKNACIITRIQLFYQIPLFCYSLALALGTIPAPRGQDIWAGIGSTGTCEAQGFLLQFGLHGVVGWDSVLSTTYLMMVRYKVANLRMQSWEKYYHMVIWSVALVMSIVPLAKDMYNFNNTICWLESYPDNCVGSDCERGEGATLWQNLASLMSMLHLFYSVTIMICLYCSIRGLENTKHRYVSSELETTTSGIKSRQGGSITTVNTCANRRYSRAVGIQGMLYAGGMILTLAPTASYIVVWNAAGLWSDGFAILATSLVPLVGYVNFVIFMRGRTVESCHTTYAKWLRKAHSCLFDYNCFSACQRCGPNHEHNTELPAPQIDHVRQPEQSTDLPHTNNHDIAPSATSPTTSRNEHVKERSGVSEGGTDGAWTGFLVRVKKRGQRFSQWVSELGASLASISEDEYSSDFDDERPPSRLVRVESEVVEGKAPTKPVRMLSGSIVAESDEENSPTEPMRMLSGGLGVSDHNNQQSPMTKPMRLPSGSILVADSDSDHHEAPTMPKRLESCALELSEEYVSRPDQHNDRSAPPVKPERYLSEVEPQHSFRRTVAPTKPERLVSEVEPQQSFRRAPPTKRRAPPTKPERLVSEVEPQLSFRRAPPTKPERLVSEVEPQLSFRRAPPPKPERLVSEFEREPSFNLATTEIEKQNTDTVYPAQLPSPLQEATPPVRPERFISEVEQPSRSTSFDRLETIVSEHTRTEDAMPASKAPPKKSLLKRLLPSAPPPCKPERCVSEFEAPERASQSTAPPVMPARYVSEVEQPEPNSSRSVASPITVPKKCPSIDAIPEPEGGLAPPSESSAPPVPPE